MNAFLDDPDELQQSHIEKRKATVLKVVSTIQNFTIPWRVPDKNRYYSLASGSPVSIDVENDVLNAEDLGQSLKEEFINQFKVGLKYHFFVL